MIVEQYNYPGWSNHPSFRIKSYNDFIDVCEWMHQNKVEHFLLSSGSNGYIFQVRKGLDWFLLRWV